MSTPPIRLLGPVAVDGPLRTPLPLGPARQRAVLAALLLEVGRPVSGWDLITRVWGEEPPPAADQALRSYLCRLRKIVDGSLLRLERRDGGYLAVAEPADVDLAVFRRLATRARVAVRDGHHDSALTGYGQALALAAGEPLAGVGSGWLDEQRGLLDRERRAVALERNDLALATGAPDVVVGDALRRLADDPYDERVAGQAMLSLAAVGRTADALATFSRVRGRLGDDLGIDPGPALREIHQRVLAGQAVVARATATGPRPVTPRRPVPRQLPPAARGFVDREDEMATLDRILLAPDDEPTSAVVCGPGGAGKTALAVRWARQHADRFGDGQLYVDLHGFDVGCRPTTPESALRTLLTALGVEPAGIPADLGGMVGAYRTLLADRRVLLVADDVAASEQVRPLLPPGPGSAALLTSRSGLPGLVTGVGAQVVPVGLLDDAAARELLARRLGAARTSAEPAATERLVARCGGLPLALAILAGRAATVSALSLTSLADELDDDSRRLAALNGGEVGTDLDAVVTGSVAVLSPTARSVLGWLAASPRVSIRTPAVAALADLTEARAAATVAELVGIHLLEPDGPGRFRLHDLVRLAVRSRPVAGIAAAVDRLLTFLVDEPRGKGQDAADLLIAAAFAVETAREASLCDLVAALEVLLSSAGRWSELAAVTDQAVAAARRLGDDHRLAEALIGRGRAAIGQRRFAAAEADLTHALTLARATTDRGLCARAHRALARWAAHQHRYDVALRHDECGLDLHRQTGNVLGQAHGYNAIGWHQAHLGRAAEALANCRRGLMIFVEHDDRSGQALTEDSIGFALDRLGRTAEARTAYERAAEACRALGWQVMLANTLVRLADVCQRLGDDQGAERARSETEEIVRITGPHALEP